MNHSALKVSDTDRLPEISLNLAGDAMSGWNLEIVTKSFEFAPKLASQEYVMGKGHAHLYIDGVKVGRVYSNWVGSI